MNGAIALVGSAEFTPALEPLDRELLAATGRSRPRVAIVAAWPTHAKGEAALLRWEEMARQHFVALGAEVEPIHVRAREDAESWAHAQAVGEADLVYLAGSDPDFLCRALHGSALERALREAIVRGALVAGSSGGAAALGGHRFALRPRVGWPVVWQPALGLIPGVAVATDYDARAEVFRLLFVLSAPPGSMVVGIDGRTALIGRDQIWQVRGQGRVTVWRGRRRTRHREGDVIRLR